MVYLRAFETSLTCDSAPSPAQVDERLSEVERLVLYLNGGQIIQQRQAIRV